MASGRVVVIAVFELLLGSIAILVGAGPQLSAAEPEVRWLGAAGIALGVVIVLGGGALAIRSRYARALGSIGALASAIAGGVVAVVAVSSLDTCVDRPDAVPCQVLVASIAVTGAGIGIVGAAAGVALQRASGDAFRRPERR